MYFAFGMLTTLYFCSVDVSRADGGITQVMYQIPPCCNSDAMWIILLWSIVDDRIGVCEKLFSCGARIISSCGMTNMAFVPFWPVLSQPWAMPPKSFPNAVCQTCHGIMHQFLITGDCASCYSVDHRIGVMHNIDGHFGMFHEHAWCVHVTEGGCFSQGEQV